MKYLCLLFFIFNWNASFSQESSFILFGGDKNDVGNTIIKKQNGSGFLIGGSTRSFGNGSSDFFLIDIEKDYSVINQLTFGSPFYDNLQSILSFGNNYLLFGTASIASSKGDLDFHSVLINPLGEIQGNHYMTSNYMLDIGYKAIKTSDGNYLSIGMSKNSMLDRTHGQSKLFKVSSDGTELFQKDYGGFRIRDYGFDMLENSQGYVLLNNKNCEIGLMASFPMMKQNSSVSLLQVDFNGNVIWEYDYPGLDHDLAYSMTQFGQFIYVAMNTMSFGASSFDIKILKVNLNGQLVDSISLGGSKFEYAHKIISDLNGDLIICGTSASNVNRPSFYAAKIDTACNMIWETVLEENASIYAYDVIQKSDSNYIFTGKYIHNQNNSDVFVLELLPTGKELLEKPEISFINDLDVYPNPTDNRVIIKLNSSKIEYLDIYDLKGQLVFSAEYLGNAKSVGVDLGDLKSGLYLIKVRDEIGNIHNSKISVY